MDDGALYLPSPTLCVLRFTLHSLCLAIHVNSEHTVTENKFSIRMNGSARRGSDLDSRLCGTHLSSGCIFSCLWTRNWSERFFASLPLQQLHSRYSVLHTISFTQSPDEGQFFDAQPYRISERALSDPPKYVGNVKGHSLTPEMRSLCEGVFLIPERHWLYGGAFFDHLNILAV